MTRILRTALWAWAATPEGAEEVVADVEWRPVQGRHDAVLDEEGRPGWVFDVVEEPPVRLAPDGAGGWDVVEATARRAGTTAEVYQLTRVDDPDADLEEGEYRLVSFTEGGRDRL